MYIWSDPANSTQVLPYFIIVMAHKLFQPSVSENSVTAEIKLSMLQSPLPIFITIQHSNMI